MIGLLLVFASQKNDSIMSKIIFHDEMAEFVVPLRK